MENKQKIPQVRFKGFTDAWEQRELGEVLSFLKDGTHGTHKNSDEGIYLLSAKNIKNGEIIIDEISDRKISKEEFDIIHSTFKLQRNDVLLTIVGSIGEVAILKNPDIMTFQRSVAFLRPNEELISSFLKTEIESDVFQKELLDRKSQSAQPGVYLGELGKIPFAVPLLKEQQQIGNYFRNLDNLITLHQRKCDTLQKLKKSMLQKMFPKNDSLYPEIRFEGFTDAWEQRRFGELGSVAMCKRVFKEQTLDTGEIPFYKIGTFGGEPDAFISRELFEEYKCKFSYPENGDMLISASGTIGRTVEYTGKDEYFQDSNIVWFKHNDRIDNSFLKCLYSIVKWSGIEGSTIKRLYNDNFLKTEFMLPCVEEQQQIGNYFRNLDNLITLHQRKLETLKKLKKSMLQKMFI